MDTGTDTGMDTGTVAELLAGVWSEVLDGVPVGPADNFFDLGGDSLLIIEAVALAREEGLEFTPLELIEYQTVAELAARIAGRGKATGVAAAVAAQGPGEFALTAAQERFCLAQPYPQYVTQSVLWCADGLDPARLGAALAAVLDHHDSFRLRLHHTPDGSRLRYADQVGFELERHDLSAEPADRRAAALLATTTRLQRSVDPVTGPLVRAALFDLGAGGQRLFVSAHHLAVDSASWRILRGDLTRSVRRLELGQPLDLPAATSSYGAWAEQLAQLPSADRTARQDSAALVSRATTATVRTDAEVTGTLLRRARSELGAGLDAVVVAAVAQVVARAGGVERVAVDIERHGRDTGPAEWLDISRTTGWFTRLQTVRLAADGAAPRTLVKSADQELHGAAAGFESAADATVLVNYLGRFTERAEELFGEATEAIGADRHPDNLLSHPVEVHAAVDGAHLVTVFSCAGTAPAASSAQALAAEYATLLTRLAAELRGEAS
ncbi:condensation domain-containing protein [Kitasatospora sp. NPDC052896]|uniref:condensation domain-containing protein n=1 Tax=Kitasatospora sp. NPDC052896 TaxID=3364061 RepID=UPI0037CBEDF1